MVVNHCFIKTWGLHQVAEDLGVGTSVVLPVAASPSAVEDLFGAEHPTFVDVDGILVDVVVEEMNVVDVVLDV